MNKVMTTRDWLWSYPAKSAKKPLSVGVIAATMVGIVGAALLARILWSAPMSAEPVLAAAPVLLERVASSVRPASTETALTGIFVSLLAIDVAALWALVLTALHGIARGIPVH